MVRNIKAEWFSLNLFRYHNEDALKFHDERLQGDVPSLSFNPIRASDAGEYYCSAENEVGKGQSNMVKLNVICKKFKITS
jgi:hypothetical protein